MVSGALIMYMYKILQYLRMVILHHNNLPLLTTATTNGVCANFNHQVDCIRIYAIFSNLNCFIRNNESCEQALSH
jgi:hypothetical protein